MYSNKFNDLHVEGHGSVVMIRPLSDLGRTWLRENVQYESWQWFGGALSCEPRMIEALTAGAIDDGLRVS